jgi:hypothetical protein
MLTIPGTCPHCGSSDVGYVRFSFSDGQIHVGAYCFDCKRSVSVVENGKNYTYIPLKEIPSSVIVEELPIISSKSTRKKQSKPVNKKAAKGIWLKNLLTLADTRVRTILCAISEVEDCSNLSGRIVRDSANGKDTFLSKEDVYAIFKYTTLPRAPKGLVRQITEMFE